MSHNSKDKPAVQALAASLRAAGVSCWFDEEQLRPGVPWQPQLASGIAASRSIAVLVGADGLGPWEDEEQQAALALAVRDRRPVIPVLLPAAPQAPSLPMFLGNRMPADAQPAPPQPPPAPAPKREKGPRDSRCDVLLLYVNDKERTAIIETFADAGGRPPQPRLIQGLPCLDLGEIGGRHILATATNMGSATPGGSATLALDAIGKLDPRWVLAVGVAFGMNPDKHPIGTILVSDRVSCYEPQRVGKKTVRRGDTVTVHPHLKQQFQMVSTPPYWTGDPVCFGEILSGEKLIDEAAFKDKLRRAYPEAIGGEMEAAGIYSAALLESRQWIVVKAVCDYADGHKGEDKDARQTLAAGNAARFVRHVLSSYDRESDPTAPEQDLGSDEQQTASPIHDRAVAAIAESLRRLPELCAALAAQPAIRGVNEPGEIAKRLCALEATGLRAAIWLAEPVGLHPGCPPPLVVITTNEERELPAAFLRRCMVLKLQLPTEPAALRACLVRRGGEHFGADCTEAVRTQVAEQLIQDRIRARDLGRPAPGQAEYLDLLRALVNARGADEAGQRALFIRIARFALDKTGTA